MLNHLSNLDVVLGISGLVLTISFAYRYAKRPGPLPPGPKPLPFIGNLLDMPKGKEWEHWSKHKRLYGPISSVEAFGQRMIIINDHRIATELLDKRSSTYPDRPTMVFAGELCGWNGCLVMQNNDCMFRAYRKHIRQYMGTPTALSQHHILDHIEAGSHRFLLRVLNSPKDFVKHLRKSAGASILKTAYGYTIESERNDPLIDLADEAMSQFSIASQPGVWFVDIIPFLKYLPRWMPGAGFKQTAAEWHSTLMDLVEKPFAFVQEQMATGSESPSFVSNSLGSAEYDEGEEYVVKWAAASLYAGGSDTTVSALSSFFLAMTLYPDIQKRAQAEIDQRMGPDRLPTCDNRADLPYVDALCKEVLRWNPVAPIGIPHVSSADDSYERYWIPKGTLVITNIWEYMHDSETYRDPYSFNPERFLGDNPELDPRELSFGFGRRTCPGKDFAEASVFSTIASTLAVFDITKARDGKGHEIEPVSEYTSGVVSHPKEFECSILPRSSEAVALIRSIADERPLDPA